MIATTVMVTVKKEHIEEFINESILNHQESIKESGNLRFDILQSLENPAYFLFYEAYETQESAAAHKTTAHYTRWKNTVADWMAEPRKGVPYVAICPQHNQG